VCNLAIARCASVQITESTAATQLRGDQQEGAPLVAAAVRRAGLRGAQVTLRSDFPIGAGLGGSSAAGVALQGALAAWREQRPDVDRAAIAEASREVEVVDLGVPGGRQDHYAAAFGGALGLLFRERVDVQRIPLTERTRAEIEQRMLLVYSGQSRISGDTITAVIDAFRARERRVVDALAHMKALARQMIDALGSGDIDALGALVGEHWTNQRALHPAITTERIEAIIEHGRRAGALGAKALGASGGGCVLLIASADAADRVRAAVSPLGDIVSFGVDEIGLDAETLDHIHAGHDAWP
jgi:D-glycero-alpha-D-manno-heptose-7-phosphate kinase